MKLSTATLGLAAVLAVSSFHQAEAIGCPKNIANQLNALNQGSTPSSFAAKFNAAPESVRDSQFFTPSQELAANIGANFDITRAQIYDAAIQFGASEASDLVRTTSNAFTSDVAGTSGSTVNVNGHKVDEIAWLNRFLQERLHSTKHSDSNDASVKLYQSLIDEKQYNWDKSVSGLAITKRNIIIWC
ncbi:hypothetical protein FBU59_004340 [Linderina macrospora]|uniref:Uncharacterized protein n=1 Tax=Linderina macrospora TaxID=4868 RepID=A0ACC1J618_9FUNG|nr:hypothetical protein FBU59_004340 [Linderina macrospora]